MTKRRYLQAEVSISCVDTDSLADAVALLDAAVRAAFPPDYDSDIEVEPIESAGFTQ